MPWPREQRDGHALHEVGDAPDRAEVLLGDLDVVDGDLVPVLDLLDELHEPERVEDPQGVLAHGALEQRGVGHGLTHAHVDHDLLEAGHVHDVVQAEQRVVCADRLHLDDLSDRQRDRVALIQAGLTYRDSRVEGFDAATLIEVIEHLEDPAVRVVDARSGAPIGEVADRATLALRKEAVEIPVNVTVPAGVDNGSKIRLAGQGEPGAAGGPPGDLLLSFRVETDSFFTRDGLDVECTIHVNLAQAVLGSKVKVRTVDGQFVVLKVPAGTQPGRRFRIKGMGVEKSGRRGDQFVKVQVDVPDQLDEPARKEFEEFAAAAGMRH